MTFTTSPSQRFSSSINEELYKFEVNWNRLGFWVMDIEKDDRNTRGIKLVSGIDILKPFPHLKFSMKCDKNEDPSRNNINEFDFVITQTS